MPSVNRITLIGHAGRDAELKYSANGNAVSDFTMAVSDRKRNQAGNWEDKTTWFRVRMFGNTAENVSQYVTKGKTVYVEGRLELNEWEDKEGNKRASLEVMASNITLLDKREDDGGQRQNASSRRTNNDEGLPFE